MKLNFFINTLGGGGAEKVLVDLVNRLPAEKFDITVTTLLHGVHETRLAPHVKHNCIVKTNNRILSFCLVRVYCKMFSRALFAKRFLKGEYDYMISYLEGFNTQVLAAYKGGAKRIAFVHCNTGVDNTWVKTYASPSQCLQQYRSFDQVRFISQDALDGFEKVVGPLTNARVVHNVIDYERVISLSKEVGPDSVNAFSDDGIRLVSVGRLIRVKGYERLLGVIGRLQRDGFRLQLTICGDGDLRRELERKVKEDGLVNIRFLGFQSNPYYIMKLADYYVCSSYSEGYSTSVAEAIALGLPVLTTDCSGMREILCDGEYGVIAENSEEGLYQDLKGFLSDPCRGANLKEKATRRSKELLAGNPIKEYLDLFATA